MRGFWIEEHFSRKVWGSTEAFDGEQEVQQEVPWSQSGQKRSGSRKGESLVKKLLSLLGREGEQLFEAEPQ